MSVLDITDYLNNEIITYRIEKREDSLKFQWAWSLAALLTLLLLGVRVVQILVFGKQSLDFDRYDLLWRGFAMVFLWWSSVPYLIQYYFADLVKTDKHIFLRRGLSRNVYIIPLEEVAEVETVDYRALWGYVILFKIHLKDGRCVRTGNLYPCYQSFKTMEKHLKAQTRKPRGAAKAGQTDARGEFTWKKGNGLLTFVMLLPVLVFSLLGIAGAVDINSKLGVQDIVLKGTVTGKELVKVGSIDNYGLKYKGSWIDGDEEYVMDVNKETYNQYASGDTVRLEAKKGCLGMIYNVKMKFEKK